MKPTNAIWKFQNSVMQSTLETNPMNTRQSERKLKHHACDSCEVLFINGLKCHEAGCPDAWKDYRYECDWCGTMFSPESKHQRFCCDDCGESYMS